MLIQILKLSCLEKFFRTEIIFLSLCFINLSIAGDFSEYGTTKIIYRGIFDKSIYDQSRVSLVAGKLVGNIEFAQKIDSSLAIKIGISLMNSGVDLTNARDITNELTKIDRLSDRITNKLHELIKQELITAQLIQPCTIENGLQYNLDFCERLRELFSSLSVENLSDAAKIFQAVRGSSNTQISRLAIDNKKRVQGIAQRLADHIKRNINNSEFISQLTRHIEVTNLIHNQEFNLESNLQRQITKTLSKLDGEKIQNGDKIKSLLVDADEIAHAINKAQTFDSEFAIKIGNFLSEFIKVESHDREAIFRKLLSFSELNIIEPALHQEIALVLSRNPVGLDNAQQITSVLLEDPNLRQRLDSDSAKAIGNAFAQSAFEHKRLALKAAKLDKINIHFIKKIKESDEYRALIDAQQGWGSIIADVTKGLLTSFAGWFSLRGGEAIGRAADQFFPDNSVLNDKIKEIKKKVEKLKEVKHELEKGIEEEIVFELEQEYIANKFLIPFCLQQTIETMLIRLRNEEIEISQKWEIVRNALDMPFQQKKLNLDQSINAFDQNRFFHSFNDEVKDMLKNVVYNICYNSQHSSTNDLSLRTTCYIDGPPGSGKTSAIRELARTLGLPCYEITINDISELSRDNAVGARGWQHKIGWLSNALMKKNEDNNRYTNGFLLLNDYDRVLFQGSPKQPNANSLSFLLDFLDTEKRSYHSPYFDAEIPIDRLNIFVTANMTIPKSAGTVEKNPFAALLSRVDIISFTGFSKNELSIFARSYLALLSVKYQIVLDEAESSNLINKAYEEQESITGQQPIELRDLKKRLEKLVLKRAIRNPRPSNSNAPSMDNI